MESKTVSKSKESLKKPKKESNKKNGKEEEEDFSNITLKKGKQLNSFQHILLRPDMYLGSITTEKSVKWIYSEAQKCMIKRRPMLYNEGLERIFIELLSNIIDNQWESDEIGIPQTYIHITLDEDTGLITARNDGRWISVEKQVFEYTDEITGKVIEEKLYPPEIFFGRMRAGTNYDDSQKERKTSGRNGVGIKATNVFSKKFTVTCVDPKNELIFYQEYSNNLTKRSKPTITKTKVKKGYTEISYLADFERFGFKDGYTEDFKGLIKKNVYDCAMWTGLNVSFNKQKLTLKSFPLYPKLYYTEKFNSLSLSSEDCQVILAETPLDYLEDASDITHISFVNGIYTKNGGTHVEAWKKATMLPIVSAFNAKNNKKGEKPIKITQKDVAQYFTLFIRCEVDKPKFDSQHKHFMVDPKIKAPKLTAEQLKKIMKWNFVQNIEDKIRAKQDNNLKSTDGKKVGKLRLKGKATEANNIKKESEKCTLILTEGDSAKTYADTGISSILDGKGRDYFGTFPLRGKIVNSTKGSEGKINDNQEIKTLKLLLGLKHGTDYSDGKSFKELRYGKLLIMTDADTDGAHIAGLILDFFYVYYPSLIERNYISIMRTPIIKCKHKGKEIRFYREQDFYRWREENSFKPTQDNTKYYKGLATNTYQDADLEFENRKVASFCFDGTEEASMKLGFHKDFADNRKEWITSFDPSLETVVIENGKEKIKPNEFDSGEISVTNFINDYLCPHHVANVHRCLPNIFDGLKDVNRKTLYSCFLRNLVKSIKVSQLAGYISEKTSYHHGETALQGAITKMGQGYVGSNNIPLLKNDGQFGSRLEGGEDAGSPRYIFTCLEEITRSLFPKQDDELLERRIEDGDELEPLYYVPILPTILINGAIGVASGYSTKIPKYNPLDIANHVRCWINKEKDYPELTPWYRNFKGKIVKTDDGTKGYSEGILEKIADNEYHVNELPIGLWADDFINILEELVYEKKLKDFKTYCSPNTMKFVLYSTDEFEPSIEKTFKCLRQPFSLTNMYALNEKRLPEKFKTVEELLERFCIVRYDLYKKRKVNELAKLRLQLKKQQNKYRFIKEITIDETLIIARRNKKDIHSELEEKKYDKFSPKDTEESDKKSYDYLLNMKITVMTIEDLAKLKEKIEETKKLIEELKNKTEGELWLTDIDNFEKSYEKFLKTRVDDSSKQTRKKKDKK